jgi:hypothetical protein
MPVTYESPVQVIIAVMVQSDRTLKEIPVEFDFSGADGIQKRGRVCFLFKSKPAA